MGRPHPGRAHTKQVTAFYRQVTEGQFLNATVPRAADGALTAILSQEAALRRVQLCLDDLVKENRRPQVRLIFPTRSAFVFCRPFAFFPLEPRR